jgi:hypothetical protein
VDTRKLSRYTGAAVLTLAPIGFVAGAWTEPFYDNDAPAAVQLAEVADQPMPASALRVLVTLLILLMPVAMIYAMRLARRGAPRLAAIGGAISFLAWSAGIASIGAVEGLYWHGSRMADRGAVAAVIDAATGDAVFNTLIAIFVLGHLVGMLTLGIGLWRSRAVPAWVGILFALSPILHAVGMNIGTAADTVAYALLGVAMIGCAVRLVRVPDDEWDLPAAPARRRAVAPEPERVAA